MARMEKEIYVYESWTCDSPILLGTLFVEMARGSETYSFEYDYSWLKTHLNSQFMLDPNLDYYVGRQYPTSQEIFGIFSDSSPDRWGQVLMKRREAIQAKKEDRKPRKLLPSDFLIGVYDETRMGALQFKVDKEGPFVSDDDREAVPPWTTLRDLEEAARGFEW